MCLLVLSVVCREAWAVALSFFVSAFVVGLNHMFDHKIFSVPNKTNYGICRCRIICRRRYKHSSRIIRAIAQRVKYVPYIACKPSTISSMNGHHPRSVIIQKQSCKINSRVYFYNLMPGQLTTGDVHVKRKKKKSGRRTCDLYNSPYVRRNLFEETAAPAVNVGIKGHNWSNLTFSFLQAMLKWTLMIGVVKGWTVGFFRKRCFCKSEVFVRALCVVGLWFVPCVAISICHHQCSISHESFKQEPCERGWIDYRTKSTVKKNCIPWIFRVFGVCRVFGFVKFCCESFSKIVWIKNWKRWMLLIYLMCTPVGEAINPGPSWHVDDPQHDKFLWIGNANPAQLLHKEHFVSEWGKGVWTFSETSATDKAIPTIRTRIQNKGFKILFGAPVAPQQKTSIMRGKPGGVATAASSLPIRPYVYPMPQFLNQSTRFMDCVVQINKKQSIYISTIYGVAGQNSAHPLSLTIDIFNQAAERALSFKGPAAICGDLNVPIESLEMWETLQKAGWFDAGLVDAIKFQRDVQPTSKHGTRHSYILMNRYLAASFYSCRTSSHFEFDAHPLLVAGFNLEVIGEMQKEWVLPKSFDSFLFDPQVLKEAISKVTVQRTEQFEAALKSSNMNEAAKCFTLAVEESYKHSAVDCEGNKIEIPAGHFGRASGKPFRFRQVCVPCIKPGRNGDFNPIMSQTTCSLRYHTKQLRRIMSLKNQIKALNKNFSGKAKIQCLELWNCIITAHGFRHGFAAWICRHVQCEVPLSLPDETFVEALYEKFQEFHNKNLREHYLANCSKAKLDLEIDIQKGGSRCFNDVKDLPTPPLDAIHWTEECEVARVAWKKEGKTCIPVKQEPKFDKENPIVFQGQKRFVVSMTSHRVILDSPVTLKNSHDLKIRQEKSSARPTDMHEQLEKFWASLWQRDKLPGDDKFVEGQWEDANNFLTCLSDCPTCPFQPLTRELWMASLKGVKKKSARGADGFSTRDFALITDQLLDWLLEILKSIEDGNSWPEQWSVSKVTVLGKGKMPKSPLDIRPITILPKVYRLWSRLRSLEVLRHLKKLMPAEVAATAGGISADQIAAYTSALIEQKRNSWQDICGLIIDLIKCYNTIPWEPCKGMLTHLVIPEKYQIPFFAFLQDLKRAFQIHGHCGELITCTTGVPEGCAMSVAIMSALSWWCYATLNHQHEHVSTIAYADNWGIIAEGSRELFDGTQTLFKFVEALRMKVSEKKSWFWGSSEKLRKQLRQAPAEFEEIPVVNHAVDLGCDQSYTRKKICTKLKERVSKARRVLKRISKKTLPKRFRPTIIHSRLDLGRLVMVSKWSKHQNVSGINLGLQQQEH